MYFIVSVPCLDILSLHFDIHFCFGEEADLQCSLILPFAALAVITCSTDVFLPLQALDDKAAALHSLYKSYLLNSATIHPFLL